MQLVTIKIDVITMLRILSVADGAADADTAVMVCKDIFRNNQDLFKKKR